MLKYILKRLGISLIVLLGVSVIIYSLVRMMPNDYVDNKYSSQLSQGSITWDDIDRFKELYGLSVPQAYFSVDVEAEGTDENGQTVNVSGTYSKKVREKAHENALLTDMDLQSFVRGDYSCNGFVLSVNERYAQFYKAGADGKKTGAPIITATYEASAENGEVSLKIRYLAADITKKCDYSVAKASQKFGAILGGYFKWLGNLLKGDLGYSFQYGKSVNSVISENMWVSFAIALIATILQFLIAIPLGISSATHQYSVRDYAVTVFTMIGISLPTYFFGAIVIKAFAVDIKIFPASGLVSGEDYGVGIGAFFLKLGDILHHLALPILVNVLLSIGGLMRYTRTNTLEVLNSDYIRTARAKGLSEHTVIYKHAFRNTMIPLATLLAGILPSLFGGMMITEEVFGIDGIGRLAYQALRGGDVPFVMGYNMFLAILTVIGTLCSDIMYSIVDPRVKLGD